MAPVPLVEDERFDGGVIRAADATDGCGVAWRALDGRRIDVRTIVALRTDRALFCGGDGALAVPARAALARSVLWLVGAHFARHWLCRRRRAAVPRRTAGAAKGR
eukprot:2425528-Prymnesium_polylepis.1